MEAIIVEDKETGISVTSTSNEKSAKALKCK